MNKIFNLKLLKKGYIYSSFKHTFLIVATAAVLSGCSKDDTTPPVVEPEEVVDTTIEPLTKKIMDNSTVITTFVSDNTVNVGAGMKQTRIAYKRRDNLPMTMYILEVDMKTPNISIQGMAPYNDYITGLQTISEMSRDNEMAGTHIMAAINGDFYNTSTGAPLSAFYINNRAYVTTVPAGRTFFGQMNDGTLVIGGVDTKGVTRPVDRALLKNAVGGAQWLIDNNVKVPTFGDVSIEPRTAIGYTANNVIYAVVVDGRQEAYSNGINFPDLRDIFAALGVKDAINLDGGGSSTLVTKDVAANKWLVQNKPSQAFNAERLVGNGLAFVLKR